MLISIIGVLSVILGTTDPELSQPLIPKPNVLIVLVDDWGTRWSGAYSDSNPANTPVLDLVASQGLVFDRMYTEPFCSPTRATILTGRQSRSTGVGRGIPWVETEDFLLNPFEYDTLPGEMGMSNYFTGAFGKWHLTTKLWNQGDAWRHPIDFGFDEYHGIMANPAPFAEGWTYYEWLQNDAWVDGDSQTWTEGTYLTTDQVDDTIAFIQENTGRQWFAWLALTAPHSPWDDLPPQELVTVDLSVPSNTNSNHKRYNVILEAADTEIGRLLSSIRPAVLDNTIVFIMGDNGTPAQVYGPLQHPYGAKGTMGEEGIRVPFFAWTPGIRAGRVDNLLHSVDLYATILDIGGRRSPSRESRSFKNLLMNEPIPRPREHVYVSRRDPLGPGPWTKNHGAVIEAPISPGGPAYKLRRQGNSRTLYVTYPGVSNEERILTPYTAVDQEAFDRLNTILEEYEN